MAGMSNLKMRSVLQIPGVKRLTSAKFQTEKINVEHKTDILLGLYSPTSFLMQLVR